VSTFVITLAAALVVATGRHAQPAAADALPADSASTDSTLAGRVAARIAQLPGAVVGVAYGGVSGPLRLAIARDSAFHAASTMKVPVMIELFRRIDAGALALDQDVLLVNRFGSIVDGSPYALDPAADSDSSLYARVGTRVSVRELIERMIVRSSNLATNALIELAGAGNVAATTRHLGATRTRVLRGVEDGKAFERGLNNATTAGDLSILLRAIEQGRAASPASCRAMLDVLLRQEFNGEIPAGLPPGTRVAHKTGQITATLHDAAIVYPPAHPPYVLVVLTRGIPDEAVARQLIADLSRLVWEDATR
jgi:beta-lactamase class A